MNKKVLLVDDDIAVQTVLKDFLTEEGCAVDTDKHGRTALEKIKTGGYNLLLIDIRLPDISGLDLLEQVKTLNKDMCCVMITAYPDLETATRALRHGAFEYIQKPLKLDEIKYTIDRAFEYIKLTEENKKLIEDIKASNFALEEEKQRTFNALWEGAKIMGATTSLDDFFNIILDVVVKIAQVKICSIMLLNENAKILKIKAAKGLEENIIKNTSINIGDGISGWVAQHKEPIFISNIEQDDKFKRKNRERYFNSSLISVPLIIQDKAVGVLNVNNKLSGSEFTKDDLHIISALAKQISITIENNKLYTELREVNVKIMELQEQLFATGKLATVGEIASVTAHEINTPLTTMMGYVNLLPSEIGNEEFRKKFVGTMEHEIQRITQITKRLLEFTRKGKSTLSPVDVNNIIKQTLIFVEHNLAKKGIKLKLDLMSDIPVVDGSFDQLEQVFLNMITNATHAMQNGGELVISTKYFDNVSKIQGHSEEFKLIISTYSADKWVEASFSDSGAGISEENLKKLFKPFFTTKKEGTGLGLSICKSIISEHGGLIDVVSTVGRGTTFYIYLPVQRINK